MTEINPDVLRLARKIAQESITDPSQWDVAFDAAIQAIYLTTGLAAKMAAMKAAAIQPTPVMGDDDSIYLSSRQEGALRAYDASAADLRTFNHLKGSSDD